MKKVLAIILAAALVFSLAACGSSGGGGGNTTAPATQADGGNGGGGGAAPSGDAPSSIKVAVISPMTGALAEQGESAPWMVEHFTDYINNELGGIEFADYGTKLPVEFVLYDNESSSTKASEVTLKAITDDGVDLVLACHVPDMVIPVSQVCDSQEVPAIHFDCPSGPWEANGPFEWAYLAHTDAPTYVDAYESIWKAAGYEPGDTTIGLIFGNDTDGTALSPAYQSGLEEKGWTCFHPGLYTAGTTDFSDIIRQYKDNDIKVIFGTMLNPEYAAFWEQCQQLDYHPEVVVIGKAYMLESQVLVVGPELADGLSLEGWWHRTFPYRSEITGLDSLEEFCTMYEEGSGHGVAAPVAAEYAAMEVMIDALTRAANLDHATVRDAIEVTDLDTVMGHIHYNPDTNCQSLPCVGCQWVLQDDGTMKQEIVGNGDPSNGIEITAPIKTEGAVWMK